MGKSDLRIVPLGGLGEIGKNMLVVENADDMIVIDAGVMFPGADAPGVDVIIPDLSYVLERREKLRGVMVTHGHEDHIGAIPYLIGDVNVPVYASTLAAGLVKVKLRERRLLKKASVNEINAGDHVKFGRIDVEFFRVCHSIPDAMGLAVRTPSGLMVHTGDFKFDHTPADGRASDLGKLASLGAEGVDLLLSDSTYADRPGYTPSEKIVGETLDRVIGEAKGRVIVATFASLIAACNRSPTPPSSTSGAWPSWAAAWSTTARWRWTWAISIFPKERGAASRRSTTCRPSARCWSLRAHRANRPRP